MNAWDRVRLELDEWSRERRQALFWWRDDDAGDVSAKLNRMIDVAESSSVSIGLSVIPLNCTEQLKRLVAKHHNLDVLVHGLAHVSHARAGQAKREYGGVRRTTEMEQDLVRGLALNRRAFGERALAVLVPPWNRIQPGLVQRLHDLGFQGLSTWKPRSEGWKSSGLVQVNTHLDVINWRQERAIKSEAEVASLLLRKLRWRREHSARALEPLGLLTHHQHWCREKETIIVNLLKVTRSHPAAKWLSAREVFSAQ